MDPLLFTDSVRFAHILAVCAGLGTSILADHHAARRMGRQIDDALLSTLHQYHRVVILALVGMWVTGVAMLLAVPPALLCAVYLAEYAVQGKLVSSIRFAAAFPACGS